MDANLLTKVQEYDAVPSDLASYGKTAFWDERYAADEEVRDVKSKLWSFPCFTNARVLYN